MSIFAFLSLTSAVICFTLGNFILYRNPKDILNKLFTLLAFSLAFWAFCEFMMRQAGSPAVAMFWLKLTAPWWPFPTAFLLNFVLIYTGYTNIVEKKFFYYALYGPLIIFSILDLTTSLFNTGVTKKFYGYTYVSTNLFFISTVWLFFLGISAFFILLSYYFKLEDERRKKQTIFMLIGFIISLLAGLTESLIHVFNISVPEFTTASASTLTIFIGFAMLKYDLFVNPATIVSKMTDLLVLLDSKARITMANDVALNLLDYKKSELEGQPAEILFAHKQDCEIVIRDLKKGVSVENLDLEYLKKDHSKLPVIFSSSIIKNKEGKVVNMIFVAKDVTERKRYEGALKISENRFLAVTQSSIDAVIGCIEGKTITFWNKAAEEIFGYRSEEIVGKPVSTIIPKQVLDKHDLGVKNFVDVKRSKLSGQVIESIGLRKDGSIFPIEFSSGFWEDKEGLYFMFIARDITERKKAEERLRYSEERFKSLFESAPDAIFLLDYKGKFVDVNKAAVELGGHKKEETVGRSFIKLKLLPKKQIAMAFKLLALAIGKAMGPIEFTLNRKDGTEVNIEIRSFPVVINNKKLVLGVARDITERKKIEEEIKARLKIESVSADISAIFVQPKDEHIVLNLVLEKLGDLFKVNRSYILRFHDHLSKINNTHEWVSEGTAPQMQERQNLDSSVFPWMMEKLKNNETISIEDSSKLPEEAENERAVIEAGDIKSFLIVPVYFADKLLGFIGFDDIEKNRKWSDADITLLRTVAGILASFLGRQKIEKERGKLADRMQSILDTTDEGIYGFDVDGKTIFFNKSASKMTGYKPEEVIGKDLHSLIHHSREEGSPYALEECPIFRSFTIGKSFRSDDEVYWRKDGSYFPVEYSSYPIINKGKIEGAVVSFRDISERKKIEEIIKHIAYFDTLTDLPNRRMFSDILNSRLAEVKREKEKLAVLFLDLDFFKDVNDNLGHAVGDKLLKGVAGRLKSILRANEAVARIGGDEFLVLMPRIKSADEAIFLSQRIIDTLAIPWNVEENEINISTSVGVALYPQDGQDSKTLIQNADSAMYYAKEKGRKQFQFYENMEVSEKKRFGKKVRKAA